MATASNGLPIGRAGTEAGQLPGKRRLGDMFRAAMAAAMSAAADLSLGSAGPVVPGEAGHGSGAFTVNAGSLGLGVVTSTSWEILEAGQGSTGKAEGALPHLYPGRTPEDLQAETGVTPPILGFQGAAYSEKPVSDAAASAGAEVTSLTNGHGAASGVDELAGETLIEVGEEARVVLQLLPVKTDHAFPARPLDGARLTRARLPLEKPGTVSTEVTPVLEGMPVLDETAETHFREAGPGTLEARPDLAGDSTAGSEVVTGRVAGEPRHPGEPLKTTDSRRNGDSRQEPDLSEVTATSRTLILQPARDTGTTEDAARAAGGAAVTGEREISPQDIRALAEHLREEALKRLPRTVQIRLDPPRLGTVTAVLSARGQEIAVKFVASTAEAGRALDASQGELAKGLYEQGLTLAGFAVDHGASGDGMPRGERGRTVPTGGRTGRRGAQAKPATILAVGAAATSHLGNVSRGYLDYIV